MLNTIRNLRSERINIILLISLTSLLPLTFILGSLLINIFFILISIIFIFEIFLDKKTELIKNKFFLIIMIFWFFLILNLIFSTNFLNTLPRVLGFLKFIFSIFAIRFVIQYQKKKYENFLYTIWFIIFSIIFIDLIYEFIFRHNILGYASSMPGRLAGFLNDELKIGHYFSAFFLLTISFLIYNFQTKKKLHLILGLLCLILSFLIGERSNFLKVLIMIAMFLFFFEHKYYLKKTLILFLSIIVIITSINISPKFFAHRPYWAPRADRYIGNLLIPIKTHGLINFIKSTHYGAHYQVAIKIFKDHPYFGVGIKNFRYESSKKKYIIEEELISKDPEGEVKFKKKIMGHGLHPHQIHFEILSEMGIVGYISFFIFFIYSLTLGIKSYIEEKNLYLLSSILFIIVSIIPIIPSGSFFTTYGAGLFWLNFSIMIAYSKLNKKEY